MGSLQYALQVTFSVVLCGVLFLCFHHATSNSPTVDMIQHIFTTENMLENLPEVTDGPDGKTLRLYRDGEAVDVPLLDEQMVHSLR